MALGREAISLRLIATGALIVLLFRPEALAGPSFQMSFGAVTAVVALYSTATVRRLLERREEGPIARTARSLAGIIATGVAVEIALAPMALYHFHRSGLYEVFANIVAIPLTTFLIMPSEALALVLDAVGLGTPMWWVCGRALKLLLGLAHWVSSDGGAVILTPSMPTWAFALMIVGGIWLCLWNSRLRLLGLAPALVGGVAAALAPAPDLLVTGDGMHLAVIRNGTPLLLRDRAGDYVRQLVAEASGFEGDPDGLDGQPSGACSRDACVAALRKEERRWRVLATRSSVLIDRPTIARACGSADIVVSSRRLPQTCVPKWLKLDAATLRTTGGMAIYLGARPRIDSVAERTGSHPWSQLNATSRSTPPARFPTGR